MGLFPKVISLCTQVKDSINRENMTFNDKSKNKDQSDEKMCPKFLRKFIKFGKLWINY